MTPRFVHLVASSAIGIRRAYTLHVIDPSIFFHPTIRPSHGSTDYLNALEEFQLPPAAMTLQGPSQPGGYGAMDFMRLGEGRNKRVVAVDHKRRAILFDTASHAVSTLPALHAPKISPVSFPVGDSVYVLKTNPAPNEAHCFEALIHGRGPENRCRPDWYWHSLPRAASLRYQAPGSYDQDDPVFEDIFGHALVGGAHI
ncbi:hypothetical protein PR202_ga02932 [Eleusine coracana subsp. coracana]|uniref:Uncharacterized protein n=1 Tax=Eleusine coracana subsp. coracana TaxID=191504 RepID=A0AAV5BLB5_ELECO|nr:hypothetical protein PR202_ga02932 [Eleusine coracana subsp. coracana]